MGPPAQIHTTKKAVEVPTDLKGLKMGTVGREMAEFLKAAGAAPIMGGAVADTYMNLERGLTDGLINHFPVVLVFRLLPLLKNHTMFGEGSGIGGNIDTLIMNLDKFNSFPPDIQKIIEEASAWYTEEINKIDVGFIKAAEDAAKNMNHNFVYIDTPEKLKPWQELVQPVYSVRLKSFSLNPIP
jgi:TRAP-type C4-dicarboxylate transport system substrate-binding protein